MDEVEVVEAGARSEALRALAQTPLGLLLLSDTVTAPEVGDGLWATGADAVVYLLPPPRGADGHGTGRTARALVVRPCVARRPPRGPGRQGPVRLRATRHRVRGLGPATARGLPTSGRNGASLLHVSAHAGARAVPAESLVQLAGGDLTVAAILDQTRGRPADAPGVIGTRWSVSDMVSAVFALMLHDNLRHHPPVEALRRTQVWMLDPDRTPPDGMPDGLLRVMQLRDVAAPRHWAGFTYHGAP